MPFMTPPPEDFANAPYPTPTEQNLIIDQQQQPVNEEGNAVFTLRGTMPPENTQPENTQIAYADQNDLVGFGNNGDNPPLNEALPNVQTEEPQEEYLSSPEAKEDTDRRFNEPAPVEQPQTNYPTLSEDNYNEEPPAEPTPIDNSIGENDGIPEAGLGGENPPTEVSAPTENSADKKVEDKKDNQNTSTPKPDPYITAIKTALFGQPQSLNQLGIQAAIGGAGVLGVSLGAGVLRGGSGLAWDGLVHGVNTLNPITRGLSPWINMGKESLKITPEFKGKDAIKKTFEFFEPKPLIDPKAFSTSLKNNWNAGLKTSAAFSPQGYINNLNKPAQEIAEEFSKNITPKSLRLPTSTPNIVSNTTKALYGAKDIGKIVAGAGKSLINPKVISGGLLTAGLGMAASATQKNTATGNILRTTAGVTSFMSYSAMGGNIGTVVGAGVGAIFGVGAGAVPGAVAGRWVGMAAGAVAAYAFDEHARDTANAAFSAVGQTIYKAANGKPDPHTESPTVKNPSIKINVPPQPNAAKPQHHAQTSHTTHVTPPHKQQVPHHATPSMQQTVQQFFDPLGLNKIKIPSL
jgi:hypothetical protein